MAISLTAPKTLELKPRIVVFGVGGAGGNAVNNMIESDLKGVEFVVANTDAQALHFSRSECTIQMGPSITGGLGAGADPQKGAQSAEDSLDEIIDQLDNAHMVFITAGMGGGTGTGAAPVIARAARERGILTVGVVTKPFRFEGDRRMKIAEEGIAQLQDAVDTLIVIPNQNLFRVTNEKTTVTDAFSMADEVLHSGVRGLTSLMVNPGLINLDFADVRTVMNEMGKALMGTGEASGEERAKGAARAAIANPLLDDVAIRGARGVLINIVGGKDLTLYEIDEAAELVRGEVDEGANIIVGSTLDTNLDGVVRVSVVATGIDMAQDSPAAHDIATASSETVAKIPPLVHTRETPAMAMPTPQTTPDAAPLQVRQQHFEPDQDVLDTPEPQKKPEKASKAGRFGLGFLGIRRKPSGPPPAMIADGEPKLQHRAGAHAHARTEPEVKVATDADETTDDLFGGHIDEKLEIPAFLRRQAN